MNGRLQINGRNDKSVQIYNNNSCVWKKFWLIPQIQIFKKVLYQIRKNVIFYLESGFFLVVLNPNLSGFFFVVVVFINVFRVVLTCSFRAGSSCPRTCFSERIFFKPSNPMFLNKYCTE